MIDHKKTSRPSEVDTLTEIVLQVFHLNGRFLASGDELSKEFGLTSALWQVLGAIEDEPLSMAQIARKMGRTRQSIRRSVNLLKDKGLIELRDNPDHQRAKLAALTAQGRRRLEQVTQKADTWTLQLSRDFSRKELETFLRTTQKIIQSMETFPSAGGKE